MADGTKTWIKEALQNFKQQADILDLQAPTYNTGGHVYNGSGFVHQVIEESPLSELTKSSNTYWGQDTKEYANDASWKWKAKESKPRIPIEDYQAVMEMITTLMRNTGIDNVNGIEHISYREGVVQFTYKDREFNLTLEELE